MSSGWLKLHRELIDKPIWFQSTPEQKVILMTLLMMAGHEEKEWIWKGEKFKIMPGQFITSLDSLAEKSGKGVTVKNIRTALSKFETLGFLANESAKTGRLITIVNWGVYQGSDGLSGQTSGQEMGKELAKDGQRAGKEVADERAPIKKKEVKNVRTKECKNTLSPPTPQGGAGVAMDWHSRFSESVGIKLDEWLQYKSEKRQSYKPQGLTSLLNKLEKEVAMHGETAVLEVIDSSMSSGYQGIVWDRLASSRAGTKMADNAGTKKSGDTKSFMDIMKEEYGLETIGGNGDFIDV